MGQGARFLHQAGTIHRASQDVHPSQKRRLLRSATTNPLEASKTKHDRSFSSWVAGISNPESYVKDTTRKKRPSIHKLGSSPARILFEAALPHGKEHGGHAACLWDSLNKGSLKAKAGKNQCTPAGTGRLQVLKTSDTLCLVPSQHITNVLIYFGFSRRGPEECRGFKFPLPALTQSSRGCSHRSKSVVLLFVKSSAPSSRLQRQRASRLRLARIGLRRTG